MGTIKSFQAGGVVRDHAFYVKRESDEFLCEALKNREFCYILAPRQIGKSSLRVQVSKELVKENIQCGTIDLQAVGSSHETQDTWYNGLIRELKSSLSLDFDLNEFLDKEKDINANQRWSIFLREVLLEKLSGPTVIFVDEIDHTLSLKFPVDDFFASIRDIHGKRAENAIFEKITFCIIGVAFPTQLISDPVKTPFNIGTEIVLCDFSFEELTLLKEGLVGIYSQPERLLEEIYKWTSGHPYMTIKLCKELKKLQNIDDVEENIKNLVEKLFFYSTTDTSIQSVRQRLDAVEKAKIRPHILETYKQILEGRLVEFNNNLLSHEELRLSGIIVTFKKKEKIYFGLRNKIFSTVYDLEWVKGNLRPFAEEMELWFKSNKDPQFLLKGSRLKEAVDWSSCEDITLNENAFIYESRIEEMQSDLLGIKRDDVQHLSQEGINSFSNEKDSILKGKIEEAEELLKEGKPKSAKSILLRLKNKIINEKNLSDELKYKITANLGICAFELNDKETAIKEFNEALLYQPNRPEALANAALGALLNEEYEEAARLSNQARLLKEHNSQATSIYIQALYLQKKDEEIQKLLNEEQWISEDPGCCLQIGQIKYNNNDYEEAEKLFRYSIEKNKENPHFRILLARTIASSVRQIFGTEPPLLKNFPESIKVKLQEAESILTDAINVLNDCENRSLLHEAYLERAGALALLRRLDESLEDYNKILIEDQENLAALRNKGAILLAKSEAKESIKYLEKVFDKVSDKNTKIVLGDAYLENKQYEKAISVLSDLWNTDTKDHYQLRAGSLILEAQFNLKNSNEVSQVIQKLMEYWSNDASVLCVIAEQYQRENKVEEAIAKYKEALLHATENQYERISTDLADLYYSQEKYYEAAETYGKVLDKVLDSLFLRKYLFALYQIGSYKEALEISQNIRAKGKAIPFVTEIEASILYYIDDLEGAKELLVQLCELEPEKISHQTLLLYIYVRLDQKEAAKDIISKVDYEKVKDNSVELVKLAKMSKLLKYDKELIFAFRAREIANTSETHLTYVHLFLTREDPEATIFRPDKIDVDCVVTLKNEDEVINLSIVEDVPSSYDKGIVNKLDEQAKKLLGRTKGEKVVWKDGIYEEITYEITDIRSKYVAAFQDTLNNFSFNFPDSYDLHKVSVKDNDFTKILFSIDERDKWVSEKEAIYREHKFPLSTFAKTIDTSLIYVWNTMISSSSGYIFTQAENLNNHKQEVGVLVYSGSVVLDLTALLTLGHLKLLDKLADFFENIFVARPVLDELNDVIDGDLTKRKTKGVSWKENGYYNYKEITEQDLDKWYNFLGNIRDFVKSKTKVVAIRKILEIGKDEYEKLSDTLGKEAVASILAASEYRSLLYSDDFSLRLIAHQQWKVKSVCSQSMLMAIKTYQNALTKEEYYKSIKLLILWNYYFIFVDTPFLVWLLKEEGMSTTNEVRKVFQRLEGNNHQEDGAIIILAELIRELWLESIINYKQRSIIMFLILDTLTTNRFRTQVIIKLENMLTKRFNLLPNHLQEVFLEIDTWQKMKSSKQII